MDYKYTEEYKILFLFYKKKCTFVEIAELLNITLNTVSQVIAIEQVEIKKQRFDETHEPLKTGKVKLN